jgi:hypothetical protein
LFFKENYPFNSLANTHPQIKMEETSNLAKVETLMEH